MAIRCARRDAVQWMAAHELDAPLAVLQVRGTETLAAGVEAEFGILRSVDGAEPTASLRWRFWSTIFEAMRLRSRSAAVNEALTATGRGRPALSVVRDGGPGDHEHDHR